MALETQKLTLWNFLIPHHDAPAPTQSVLNVSDALDELNRKRVVAEGMERGDRIPEILAAARKHAVEGLYAAYRDRRVEALSETAGEKPQVLSVEEILEEKKAAVLSSRREALIRERMRVASDRNTLADIPPSDPSVDYTLYPDALPLQLMVLNGQLPDPDERWRQRETGAGAGRLSREQVERRWMCCSLLSWQLLEEARQYHPETTGGDSTTQGATMSMAGDLLAGRERPDRPRNKLTGPQIMPLAGVVLVKIAKRSRLGPLVRLGEMASFLIQHGAM